MTKQDSGRFAVILPAGYYRFESPILACFDDIASARTYVRHRTAEVIAMPEEWPEAQFSVGDTVPGDMVRQQYRVVA